MDNTVGECKASGLRPTIDVEVPFYQSDLFSTC